MIKSGLTTVIVIAMMSAMTAHAQTGNPMITRMDKNADGKIDADEFTAERLKLFRSADLNRDKTVLIEEATTYFTGIAPADDPKTIRRIGDFKSADADNDGKVTEAEFSAVAKSDFAKRDKNADGYITEDEMMRR